MPGLNREVGVLQNPTSKGIGRGLGEWVEWGGDEEGGGEGGLLEIGRSKCFMKYLIIKINTQLCYVKHS